MSKIIGLGLRGLQVSLDHPYRRTSRNAYNKIQFLWTFLIICLIGNMIHEGHNDNPSIVNYVMFVAVFGMLSLIYLILATVNEDFAFNPLFVVIADALNTLFFLIGGIALAAKLGVHSCGNDVCILSLAQAFSYPCTVRSANPRDSHTDIPTPS